MMQMKPRIAIPQPHSAAPEYVARVWPQYCQAVELAGGEAVAIPLNQGTEAGRIASDCQGVLLPGSRADVDPERYRARRDPRTQPSDLPRHEADALLLQDAFASRKPVLGICYGLQSLNVWCSGSLVQHLEGEVRHFRLGQEAAPNHSVRVAGGSLLARIVQSKTVGPAIDAGSAQLLLTVNSSHHQAAATPGDGLRATAWCSEDGVIEAIEGTSTDHWVLAVQWHPERMTDANSRALFRAFIEAANEVVSRRKKLSVGS